MHLILPPVPLCEATKSCNRAGGGDILSTLSEGAVSATMSPFVQIQLAIPVSSHLISLNPSNVFPPFFHHPEHFVVLSIRFSIPLFISILLYHLSSQCQARKAHPL